MVLTRRQNIGTTMGYYVELDAGDVASRAWNRCHVSID
jgi:hypothetical protein